MKDMFQFLYVYLVIVEVLFCICEVGRGDEVYFWVLG